MSKTMKKKVVYYPKKYYSGLTKKKIAERKKEIEKFGKMHWKDPRAYVGFKTDKGAKTRRSSYTAEWNRLFPDAKSLEEKSEVTGVPLKYIKHVAAKAKAAWRSGHRPGAVQNQWVHPRVASYLLCGKAHYTADAADVRRAKKESASARKWFKRCKTSKLTKV